MGGWGVGHVCMFWGGGGAWPGVGIHNSGIYSWVGGGGGGGGGEPVVAYLK